MGSPVERLTCEAYGSGEIRGYILPILQEQLQVDLKHSLQQSHVGSLVQSNLVLPNIDDENLACRERKERTLALKVLILTSLAAVGSLHVHNQDVIRHALRCASLALLLVVRQPDTLGRLPSLQLRHNRELSAKQLVEQCRLSGGLRTEDGDEVVVETSRCDIFERQILGQVGTMVILLAFACHIQGDHSWAHVRGSACKGR